MPLTAISCRFATSFSLEYHGELLRALDSLLSAAKPLPLALQLSCVRTAAALTSYALDWLSETAALYAQSAHILFPAESC